MVCGKLDDSQLSHTQTQTLHKCVRSTLGRLRWLYAPGRQNSIRNRFCHYFNYQIVYSVYRRSIYIGHARPGQYSIFSIEIQLNECLPYVQDENGPHLERMKLRKRTNVCAMKRRAHVNIVCNEKASHLWPTTNKNHYFGNLLPEPSTSMCMQSHCMHFLRRHNLSRRVNRGAFICSRSYGKLCKCIACARRQTTIQRPHTETGEMV